MVIIAHVVPSGSACRVVVPFSQLEVVADSSALAGVQAGVVAMTQHSSFAKGSAATAADAHTTVNSPGACAAPVLLSGEPSPWDSRVPASHSPTPPVLTGLTTVASSAPDADATVNSPGAPAAPVYDSM